MLKIYKMCNMKAGLHVSTLLSHLERVCEKGGGGVGNDSNLLIYNACLLRRRWGRWGLLLVLRRAGGCRKWGGETLVLAWYHGCDVCVGRCTELLSICNDNVTGC